MPETEYIYPVDFYHIYFPFFSLLPPLQLSHPKKTPLLLSSVIFVTDFLFAIIK